MIFSGVSSTGKTVFYDADNVEDELLNQEEEDLELPEPLIVDDEEEEESTENNN